jgi:hypothetical protein
MNENERCELSGLLVSQCACKKCRPFITVEEEPKKREYDRVGPVFITAFDNEQGCECGNDILEGDEAGYLDGELHCGGCVREEHNREVAKFIKKWKKWKSK